MLALPGMLVGLVLGLIMLDVVLISDYKEKEIKPYLSKLATEIQKEVPSGLGKGRQIKFSIN